MATPESQRNENIAAYKQGVEEAIGGKKSIIYMLTLQTLIQDRLLALEVTDRLLIVTMGKLH